MFVFDDYAENIQQNQVKTAIFAQFSRFFSRISPDLARFPARMTASSTPGGRIRQLAVCRRGSNPIKNRPVAEIIATVKPAPA